MCKRPRFRCPPESSWRPPSVLPGSGPLSLNLGITPLVVVLDGPSIHRIHRRSEAALAPKSHPLSILLPLGKNHPFLVILRILDPAI